jgi:hypothetical protein
MLFQQFDPINHHARVNGLEPSSLIWLSCLMNPFGIKGGNEAITYLNKEDEDPRLSRLSACALVAKAAVSR